MCEAVRKALISTVLEEGALDSKNTETLEPACGKLGHVRSCLTFQLPPFAYDLTQEWKVIRSQGLMTAPQIGTNSRWHLRWHKSC